MGTFSWRGLRRSSMAVAITALVSVDATAEQSTPIEPMANVPPTAQQQVTLANYLQNPFSQWGFSNSSAVANSLHIARAGSLPNWMATADEAMASLNVELEGGKLRTVEQLFSDQHSTAVIVTRGDNILFERYADAGNRHQPHIWFSMTKSLVTTAFGLLVEQGKVDLEKSPADYIPELNGSGFERTTIQQVLDHTTALAFVENYTDPEAPFARFYAPALGMMYAPGAADVQPGETEIYGVHDFLAHYVEENPELQPGEAFEYNSANADVIGWLVARLSGQPLAEFIEQHIWQPLGTEHDAYLLADRALQGVATGGMNTTLRDAAQFGRLIANRGRVGDNQLVPAAWVDASLQLTDYHRRNMARSNRSAAIPYEGYHNMWWILDSKRGEYVAGGIYGQMIYIDRASGIVAAMYNHHVDASAATSPDTQNKLRAFRAIARQYD